MMNITPTGIKTSAWGDFKSFLSSLGIVDPEHFFHYVKDEYHYLIWGEISGKLIECKLSLSDTESVTDFETTYKSKMNVEGLGQATDSHGRAIMVPHTGNQDYTTQWIYRGDDIVSQKRNIGEPTMLMTYKSRGLMDLSLASSNTGDGYHLNALNHAVFKNQIPLEDYHKRLTGGSGVDGDVGNWKRKRARLKFIDNLECVDFIMHWCQAQADEIFAHPFVFMHNRGVDGDGIPCTPYNPANAHSDEVPVGFIVGNYIEEFPMCQSCCEGKTFRPQSSAQEVYTGYNDGHPFYAHLIELWFEITYNSAYFQHTEPVTGTWNKAECWMGVQAYSERNIDKSW